MNPNTLPVDSILERDVESLWASLKIQTCIELDSETSRDSF